MKRKLKNIFVFIIIFMTFSSFAQTNRQRDIDDQINELMKAREEMFRSLFNDSGFQNFDKRFQDLIKKFDQDDFAFPDMVNGPVVGEYDWRETETHQIFVLKVKQMKDRPLDIKIEKGQIKIKGDLESVDDNPKSKKRTRVHFERMFSIPEGVDQANPEFLNKDNELLIQFKKLKPKKAHLPMDQRQPLEKSEGDLTL